MADDITVSVGQVVMLKTEDEGHDPEGHDPDDPKNQQQQQVILQLQPITGNECEAETDAAVMTVEAHAETTLDGEDVDIGYPITCGDSKALLLAKKFVCPGINVKCVKYEDQLISPKQFVHMSGKATLKDWKRAIRMGGVMLRKMMDSGQLDFYQHTTLCTNTCRSTKFDLLINNTRFPPDGLTTPTSSTVGNGSQTDGQTDVGTMEWSSTVPLEAKEKKDTCDISEETLTFWKGIADVGLMGEVVTNISTELLQLLTGVQLRTQNQQNQQSGQDSDSCLVEVAVLSNLAQVFGLLDCVKKILERKKLQINPGQEHMLNTLNSLEEQLEEQSRQQQVRSLLSSPPAVNSFTSGSVKSKPAAKRPPKRPRLQRPNSTTALSSVVQQGALQQQQFTVLSPISLSNMGQSFTVAGLPLGQQSNTVTLLPAGSQVITLHPSSGLTLVDPSQLGTMMSPMELLTLSQQTGGATEVMDGTVLVQQEVMSEQQEVMSSGQVEVGDHTVIQIDPAPMLQQQDGVEEAEASVGAAADGEETEVQQEVQQEEVQHEAQGLAVDAASGVQIVVMEERENTEEDTAS